MFLGTLFLLPNYKFIFYSIYDYSLILNIIGK